ncbi:MAG TPA: ribonuclease III [Plasticicumulans sp.]|uniref:ribonuclease III n=1 Tax=Plasticicumulans sp. TaxID=2307179 RepID=UPI002CB92A7D|nr:ribonuclease III [Plasticicumulans sp.]HMV38840.1 ribonuclease III [Plasticicumulans sp.]HMW28052.1 ribonuclease III [Plasticicumulans sp.]HMW40937.1 ribonuclease III [Plasticicumulans sp.]HND97601.1 ribonuclease III [Plasticicumulans sp.]HNE01549.1 ribonuclease III [Plasticicumulans sp.]
MHTGLPSAAARLEPALGHRFRDPALRDAALTHRSAGGSNNERLEFLGDALLGCVIGEALYQRLPRAPEGDLTRLRALLVREATLAELARELALGDALALGGSELKSGGYRRASILADAFEALIGAIYLDSDFETCRRVVLALFGPRLDALPSPSELKDPKTRLQEYLQARQQPLPAYRIVEVSGEAHAQTFTVECTCSGLPAVVASGTSRRKAEQEAAGRMLATLTAGGH